MSWDVMIYNYGGTPPKLDEMDDKPSKPLGPVKKVQAAISKHLPGTVWGDNGIGVFSSKGHMIEFDADLDDPIAEMMMSARGIQGPTAPLLNLFRNLAAEFNWSFVDCSTGDYIDTADGNVPAAHSASKSGVQQSTQPADGSPKRKKKDV